MDITEHKIIVAYPTSNRGLVIEFVWCSTILVDIKCYYLSCAMTMLLGNEADIVLEYPLYNSTNNMFLFFSILKCYAK